MTRSRRSTVTEEQRERLTILTEEQRERFKTPSNHLCTLQQAMTIITSINLCVKRRIQTSIKMMQRTINIMKMITSGLRSHHHKNSRSRLTRINSFTISMKKRTDLGMFLILIISIILPNQLAHKNLKTISLRWMSSCRTRITMILILVFIKTPDINCYQTRTDRRKDLENNKEGNG